MWSALGMRLWSSADVAAYLELHIEQGPMLERLGKPLGVVQGTKGVERMRLRFAGRRRTRGRRRWRCGGMRWRQRRSWRWRFGRLR